MLVGYMRVSKADGSQTTDPQRDALVEAGVEDERLYEDRASGRRDDRPGLAECLKSLRDGDTLVVWKLDRLGRDLHHLVNTVHDLTARGIGLKVLTGQGAVIDTTTAAGKLVFGIFAALAEFERELISERTIAGLASARARGRTGGRPFTMTPAKVRLAMASMGKPNTKVSELCKELGITRQTLYRHVSPSGETRPDGVFQLLRPGPGCRGHPRRHPLAFRVTGRCERQCRPCRLLHGCARRGRPRAAGDDQVVRLELPLPRAGDRPGDRVPTRLRPPRARVRGGQGRRIPHAPGDRRPGHVPAAEQGQR